MTYRPSEEFFGPPWSARLVSLVHAGVAVGVVAYVFLTSRGLTTDGAFHYLFRERHLIDPYAAAGLFALSAVMNLLRDSMRGVQIRPGWIEYRELISAVWPRVRRYRWAQIEGIGFETSGSVSVDLWDGRREFLPPVRDEVGLKRVMAFVARARAIPISGEDPTDDLDEAA